MRLRVKKMKKSPNMHNDKLTFAIFGNTYQSDKIYPIVQLMAKLREKDATIIIENTFYRYLKNNYDVTISDIHTFSDSNFDADYVISFGGDGTLLRSAAMVGSKGIPIIGINTGHLGFLAAVSPENVEKAVDAIYDRQYQLEEHSVICMDIDGMPLKGYSCALNDIAILKQDRASMISITTYINGELLTTYMSDGLIVSTPTGSTAYSLSNGGPIMVPQANILCLTAVAPHSLNLRPVVISDNSEIKLKVCSRSHNFLAAVDGRSIKLNDTVTITIRKASHSISIIKQKNSSYYRTLREKMMWGMDIRK